jgi:hypothetical protein
LAENDGEKVGVLLSIAHSWLHILHTGGQQHARLSLDWERIGPRTYQVCGGSYLQQEQVLVFQLESDRIGIAIFHLKSERVLIKRQTSSQVSDEQHRRVDPVNHGCHLFFWQFMGEREGVSQAEEP